MNTVLAIGMPGGWEILVIALFVIIFFGAKKIPEIAREEWEKVSVSSRMPLKRSKTKSKKVARLLQLSASKVKEEQHKD